MTGDTDGEPLDDELDTGDEDADFDEDFDDEDDEDLEDEDDEDLEDLDDEDDEDLEDEDDEDFDDEDDDDFDEGYEPGDVNAGAGGDYEAGDVNTIDTGASVARGARAEAPPSDGGTPVAVLTYLVQAMADEPDAVVIRQEERRGSAVLRLHVAPRDMGRVIGRRGRTAQAIRTLVAAAGARDGVQVAVDIVDD